MIAIERTGKYSVHIRCSQDGLKELERAFVHAFQTGHAFVASQVESNLFNKPSSKTLFAVALWITKSDEGVVRLELGRTIEFRLDQETCEYVVYAMHQASEQGYLTPAELFSATLEKDKQEVTFYCHASL